MSKDARKVDRHDQKKDRKRKKSEAYNNKKGYINNTLTAENLIYGLPDQAGTGEIKRTAVLQVQRNSGNLYVSRLLSRAAASPERLIQRDNGGGASAGGPTMVRPAARPTPTFAAAANLSQYISLVRALERQHSALSSRQILAMLRQVYYGRPWSVSPTEQWREVLPGSPMMPDPRSRSGRGSGSLFNALQQSQVVGGTDVGHILAGLEALLNPTRTVELEVPGPNIIVQMPNTEFATWGGDLGSAAGQLVADTYLRRRSQPAADYFSQYASDSDLEGDIDAFTIFRGAAAGGGLASMLRGRGRQSPATPISDILSDYFLASSSALGQARANRYLTFVSSIGGSVSGNRITNKAALVNPIARRVSSFAYPWFMKEYKNARGTLATIALLSQSAVMSVINASLLSCSRIMTRRFLDWLESHL